jgi:hypothetical protein
MKPWTDRPASPAGERYLSPKTIFSLRSGIGSETGMVQEEVITQGGWGRRPRRLSVVVRFAKNALSRSRRRLYSTPSPCYPRNT